MLGLAKAAIIGASAGEAAPARTAVSFTAFGDAQLSTGDKKFGTASGVFDGSGDYIRHNGGSSGDFYHRTGQITIECFFKAVTDTGDATAAVACMGTLNGNDNYACGIAYRNYDRKVQVVYNPYNGSTQQKIFNFSGPALALNTWHHVAMSRDATHFAYWVNGTRIARVALSDATNGMVGSSGGVTLAGNDGSALPFNQGGTGYIDEFRISDTDRYGTGNSSITVPTAAFTNDANTLCLLHLDGSNGSTTIEDDNA